MAHLVGTFGQQVVENQLYTGTHLDLCLSSNIYEKIVWSVAKGVTSNLNSHIQKSVSKKFEMKASIYLKNRIRYSRERAFQKKGLTVITPFNYHTWITQIQPRMVNFSTDQFLVKFPRMFRTFHAHDFYQQKSVYVTSTYQGSTLYGYISF